MKKRPYIAQVLNQLSGVKSVRSKAMFGGYGLYSGAYFFALVWNESLFLFTDEEGRLKFKKAGMGPFVFREGQREGNYFEVPPKVFANSDELAEWAEDSVECRKKFESGKKRRR